MDAVTESSPPLTHAQTRRIVYGVLVPVFLGPLDSTILASALPSIVAIILAGSSGETAIRMSARLTEINPR
jgi:hypothetical protein